MKIDEIVCCDTGLEFPEMYVHIKKVQEQIDIPITILKADKTFEYYMFNHVKTKGKRKGEIGYGWPTGTNRWCTQALKKSVISKHFSGYKKQGYEIVEYHGIAIDEPARLNKNKEKNVVYPLAEWNMTEAECLQYCYDKGYDWGGLYEKFDRVSCWCCPNSNLKELKNLCLHFPDLWEKLKEMDRQSKNQFRLDYTLDELELRFKATKELSEYISEKQMSKKLTNAILKDVKRQVIQD